MRQLNLYQAVQQVHREAKCSIELCCDILHISRAAYYKWLSPSTQPRLRENERIAEIMEAIHLKHPDKGYRRLRDDLARYYDTRVNDKRILRICRERQIISTIKFSTHGCTRHAKEPYFIAENTLNREFHADRPDEKWLTDVTEFKYHVGIDVKKLYLSAILDLYDRRIVAFEIRDHNDNRLVLDTLDRAVKRNPQAHPMLHSDRGFQYTSRAFHSRLMKAGMTQSMSRVGKCIDNGPMEGFWGILKREQYYGRKFTSRHELMEMLHKYIHYYNNLRLQRNLGLLTPMEKHGMLYAA